MNPVYMTFSCNCLLTVIQLEAFTPGYFVYICGFLFFLFCFFLLPTAEELLGSCSKALQQCLPICLFFSVRIQRCSAMGTMGWVTHSLILFAHLWGHFSVILNWQTCLNEGSSNGVVDKRTTNIYRSCCTLLGKTSRRWHQRKTQ